MLAESSPPTFQVQTTPNILTSSSLSGNISSFFVSLESYFFQLKQKTSKQEVMEECDKNKNNNNNKASETLKFLCSYNGKILPRRPDGKLRYVGGLNRVLAVDRSVSFAELMVKIGEFCGFSAALKCQLPNGDLETLVSITSDEDLANLIEEYDRASSSKIRAVLLPRKSVKTVSPPPSVAQSVDFSPPPPSRRPSLFPAVKSVPKYFVSRGPSPIAGLAGNFRFYSRNHQENSDGIFHHHQCHQVPRCYYWQ